MLLRNIPMSVALLTVLRLSHSRVPHELGSPLLIVARACSQHCPRRPQCSLRRREEWAGPGFGLPETLAQWWCERERWRSRCTRAGGTPSLVHRLRPHRHSSYWGARQWVQTHLAHSGRKRPLCFPKTPTELHNSECGYWGKCKGFMVLQISDQLYLICSYATNNNKTLFLTLPIAGGNLTQEEGAPRGLFAPYTFLITSYS